MEVAIVRSLPDCHQQVLVTRNTKEAHDEIKEVDDVSLSLPCKRCYPRCPCNHTMFKEYEFMSLCNENASSESRVCVICEALVFGWLSLW